jgi:hypothetical protein
MHKVEFWVCAAAHDGVGVFRRTLHLPFDPTVGLLIAFAPEEEFWEIRDVTQVSEHRFCCSLGVNIDLQESWESMKQRYLHKGWSLVPDLCEPHQPPVRDREPRWLAECRGEG